MTILDRYLLWQFLRVFLICMISLTGLVAVFDAFSNLDEFLNFAEKHGSLVGILVEYYSYRSVAIFDRLSGVLVVTSAMFTLTWFQRSNELTALTAAGIPHRRVLAPVLFAAASIAALAAANRELLIPRIQHELSRNAKDLAGDVGHSLKPRYDNASDILFCGLRTFANEQRIEQPAFMLPAGLDRFGSKLAAENAYYCPPQGDRPGGYRLKGLTQPKQLLDKPSLEVDGKRVIITAIDAPGWLQPDECFVVSEVNFEQLTGGQNWKHYSSTLALIHGLNNQSLDFGPDVRVTIHARFVRPVLDVTLLFLGLPLVLSRAQRNIFLAIGMCLGIVCAFMLVVLGSQYLGSIYLLNAALAAWLPLFIFVPLAVGISEPLLV